ncbi:MULTISPECIES: hypothetical protein [unclassified Lysinibacillus]|uniref:hypothetical protein n=1 Tax=unclassified Lysinibacillus TaxID=2636778 RepID=UPI0030F686E1
MKKKLILFFTLLILFSIAFFPKGYYDFLRISNKAVEVIISKTLDSNENIDRLSESEDIFLDASLKYGLQNISSDKSSKTLYLGVSSLDLKKKKEIEKHFEKELKKIHVYDYSINVFESIP